MRDYILRLTLTNADDKPIAATDAGPTGCDKWIKSKTYPLTHNPTFREIAPGRYRLRLSLVDPRTSMPIALPLEPANADYAYPIGSIEVRE
jgi:hypothetical protein